MNKIRIPINLMEKSLKSLLPVAIATTLLTTPVVSHSAARTPMYGAINYLSLDLKDETGTAGSFDNEALALTLGYNVHKNLAVEGWLGSGVRSDTKPVLGMPVKADTRDFYLLVLRPQVAITPMIDLYGRLGYMSGKLAVSAGNLTLKERDHDFSYGLGFAFYNNSGLSFTIDYSQFYDKQDVKVRGLTLGAAMDF
jgi:hypothetical protein